MDSRRTRAVASSRSRALAWLGEVETTVRHNLPMDTVRLGRQVRCLKLYDRPNDPARGRSPGEDVALEEFANRHSEDHLDRALAWLDEVAADGVVEGRHGRAPKKAAALADMVLTELRYAIARPHLPSVNVRQVMSRANRTLIHHTVYALLESGQLHACILCGCDGYAGCMDIMADNPLQCLVLDGIGDEHIAAAVMNIGPVVAAVTIWLAIAVSDPQWAELDESEQWEKAMSRHHLVSVVDPEMLEQMAILEFPGDFPGLHDDYGEAAQSRPERCLGWCCSKSYEDMIKRTVKRDFSSKPKGVVWNEETVQEDSVLGDWFS